jgi:hypothetical protein
LASNNANLKPVNTNYQQLSYGVQGNLWNPLQNSIYGFQNQKQEPYLSQQDNVYGKPQNQLENQQQVLFIFCFVLNKLIQTCKKVALFVKS